MNTSIDREEYRLRVLIEQLQHEGRSEHEIERAVREASGRMQRERRHASRGNSRLGVFARLLPL
jgi:transcriptional/translational regulatory protein YebC/TACO1